MVPCIHLSCSIPQQVLSAPKLGSVLLLVKQAFSALSLLCCISFLPHPHFHPSCSTPLNFLFFLTGAKLLYSVVLVYAFEQQCESKCESIIIICICICIYISPPSQASLTPPTVSPTQVITEHQAGLPVLYSSFLLAIYFTHGSVYMSMLLSQFYPLPFFSLLPHFLCLLLSINPQRILRLKEGTR